MRVPIDRLACGQCPSCHWFGQSNHPDYPGDRPGVRGRRRCRWRGFGRRQGCRKEEPCHQEIDRIRAIRDFVALSTHRAGHRVIVRSGRGPPACSGQRAAQDPRGAAARHRDRPRERPARQATRRYAAAANPSRASHAGARVDALAWLKSQGSLEPEVALALAGGAPLLAAALAQPEERDWRRKVVAELARPEGARASPLPRGSTGCCSTELAVMQTWVHDLVRLKSAVEPRHHVDSVPALRAKARRARLEAQLALDRELLEIRRLVAHPLNARGRGRALDDGLQSGHTCLTHERHRYRIGDRAARRVLPRHPRSPALYAAWIPLLRGGGLSFRAAATIAWATKCWSCCRFSTTA